MVISPENTRNTGNSFIKKGGNALLNLGIGLSIGLVDAAILGGITFLINKGTFLDLPISPWTAGMGLTGFLAGFWGGLYLRRDIGEMELRQQREEAWNRDVDPIG